MKPSGIRLGTPTVTTRGMGEIEMKIIAELIFEVLSCKNETDEAMVEKAKKEVKNLCSKFPINP